MSITPIRYAVIGAGGISATHLHAIAKLPAVEVVGISDPAGPATWRMPDGYEAVPKFTDPAKMLRETKPDLVSICTPNKFHAELSILALEHGAHVACEKPMAMTVAEAEAMEAARAKAGKHGGINFSYRNVGAFRFARELIARGDLGKLHRVNCVYLQSFLGAPAQPYTWRNDISLAGFGALGDLGVHMLDGVNFITGLDYQRAVGLAQTLIPEKPDAAGKPQRITTDTNAAANTTVSMNAFSSVQKLKPKRKSKTDREFKSLRKIVPSLSGKQRVDKLEVVLEAIQYIRELEEQLCEIDPSLLKAAFVATACSLNKH